MYSKIRSIFSRLVCLSFTNPFSYFCESAQDPEHAIPKGTLLAILLTTISYLAISATVCKRRTHTHTHTQTHTHTHTHTLIATHTNTSAYAHTHTHTHTHIHTYTHTHTLTTLPLSPAHLQMRSE